MSRFRSFQTVLLFLLILATDLGAQVEVRSHYRLGRGGAITFVDGCFDPAIDLLLDHEKLEERDEQDSRRRRAIIDDLCRGRTGVHLVDELSSPSVELDWLVHPITQPVELRIRPEKESWYEVGGLGGQPEKFYLLASWLPEMAANRSAFRFKSLDTQRL